MMIFRNAVADYAAQAVVNAVLADAFPNDPIVGEEDSADLRKEPQKQEQKDGMQHEPPSILSQVQRALAGAFAGDDKRAPQSASDVRVHLKS